MTIPFNGGKGVLTFKHKLVASPETQAISNSGLCCRILWCNSHLFQQIRTPELVLPCCSTPFCGPFDSQICRTSHKSWSLSTGENRCTLQLLANKLYLSYHSTKLTRDDDQLALPREHRSKIWNKHTTRLSYIHRDSSFPDSRVIPITWCTLPIGSGELL